MREHNLTHEELHFALCSPCASAISADMPEVKFKF
jgi:hypothetical protein